MNQALFKFLTFKKVLLSGAVNRYQKVFGITAEVYRIKNRELDKYVEAFGASRTSIKSPDKFEYIKEIKILNSPEEMYTLFHANAEELEVKLGTNELLVGDVIRFKWVEDSILDYFVQDLPKTHANIYFIYTLVSQFNTSNSDE